MRRRDLFCVGVNIYGQRRLRKPENLRTYVISDEDSEEDVEFALITHSRFKPEVFLQE